ncbi:MAG TPA: LEA type 2 family protein, partial [Myxococcaceae bacterium]|nr:LEA type 2 family protein [Myxococcaceae bacterium]
MRRLFPLGAVALALALSASGCSLFRSLMGSVRKPSLNFKKASLADASLSGITVNLVYTLSNPNPVALSLQEVDYRFFVEGKQVVAGRPPKGLRIPASGKGEITLPAQVKFADVAPTVQTFL